MLGNSLKVKYSVVFGTIEICKIYEVYLDLILPWNKK